MLCALCAPCGLAPFYWNKKKQNKKKNAEARREGFVKLH